MDNFIDVLMENEQSNNFDDLIAQLTQKSKNNSFLNSLILKSEQPIPVSETIDNLFEQSGYFTPEKLDNNAKTDKRKIQIKQYICFNCGLLFEHCKCPNSAVKSRNQGKLKNKTPRLPLSEIKFVKPTIVSITKLPEPLVIVQKKPEITEILSETDDLYDLF